MLFHHFRSSSLSSRVSAVVSTFLLTTALSATVLSAPPAHGANHREAPITALDHKADITDFFAFVSYDDPSKVTLILNVDPLLEPANGPNYFPFDPNIIYAIKIDNDFDALADVTFEFRFNSEVRLPGVFTSFVGAGDGIAAPTNSPSPVAPGSPVVPPAITALDGAGSEGLSLRQNYTVTMVSEDGSSEILNGSQTLYALPSNVGPRTMPDYAGLYEQAIFDLGGGISVFAGTVEDPFWIDLGAAFDSLNFRAGASDAGVPGVLSDAQDMDDVNNYAADDVSGFNVNAMAIEVPINMLTQDNQLHSADDPLATIGSWGTTSRLPREPMFTAFGVGEVSAALSNISYNGPISGEGIFPGFIVQRTANFAITAESYPGEQSGVANPTLTLMTLAGSPIVTNDDCDANIDEFIGRALTTTQDACAIVELQPGPYVVNIADAAAGSGNILFSVLARETDNTGDNAAMQIQRMGNPLINELIIGTADKDRFSLSEPHLDSQFADYALDPLLARVLNTIYEATVGPDVLPIPTPPRTDLLPLVQYMPPIAADGTPAGPVADLLRLNTGVAPTSAASRSRLGLLAGDGAGFPNGRRLSDDVTDIAARVVVGVLAGAPFNGFPHNRIGDGVNANDAPYRETFPYLGLAHSGRDSRHVDPGEAGCLGTCP